MFAHCHFYDIDGVAFQNRVESSKCCYFCKFFGTVGMVVHSQWRVQFKFMLMK